MKIIPNKSIKTSYIKSPYFRHVPISALLELIIDHRLQIRSLIDGVRMLHCIINTGLGIENVSRM